MYEEEDKGDDGFRHASGSDKNGSPGEGVSKVGEILDLAVEFEIIKKSGSWFSYGETKLGQGRDAVKALIKDNPELMDELEQKIKQTIKENNA